MNSCPSREVWDGEWRLRFKMRQPRRQIIFATVLLTVAAWQWLGSSTGGETVAAHITEVSETQQQSSRTILTTTSSPPNSVDQRHDASDSNEEASFEERFQLGKQFASRLSNFRFQKVSKVKATRLGGSEWFINEEIIAYNLQTSGGCLVYSFGVGEWDDYTELMAKRGCHVFAFDPTVRHPTQWSSNVVFYPWGLRNSESTKEWSHPVYGNITGSFFTLPQIIQKLGHDDGRTIAAIKFDCEGCEFGAFKDLIVGQVQNPIIILNTEFHFASTLGMVDVSDVARIYYAHIYLKRNKCKLLHYKRNPGFETDEYKVPNVLTQVGVKSRFCCYELNYICGNITSDGMVVL